LADTLLTGLAPLSQPHSTVLVLGSMPGAASLAQQQYYAHPRNVFWPIMAQLCRFPPDISYDFRVSQLLKSGVALWDVIDSCQRAGSLDSAIRHEQVNDFTTFLSNQSQIQAIAFNGAKAWQSFKRNVLPLQAVPAHITLLSLPSTSPAHAAMGFAEKLNQWQQLEAYLSPKSATRER